jgi:oleandomycin transport system ATP-binding protein
MTYSILAEGLVKRFGNTVALDGVDLAVTTGSVLGLLGPNGAGKTTAVRILATLVQPDAGRASVGGYDVVRQAHQVRQLIGLAGQYASVDETLTGLENLMIIGRLVGQSRATARRRARELLAGFRLEDAAGRAVKTYSGGMRRRLDLAASLVSRPRVLFLDEPTTGLDPLSRNEMWDIVRELTGSGVTVLLTTQYLEEADQLAADIAVVDHGRVIATGTPAELKAAAGAQTLAVRPADPADLPVVVAEVTALARLSGAASPGGPVGLAGSGQAEVTGTTVTAPAADPALLPALVRRLDDAGVVIAELTLRGSTLDEVFLSLTGHRAEDPADGPADDPADDRADDRAAPDNSKKPEADHEPERSLA